MEKDKGNTQETKRYDQRDGLIYRALLKPGTKEYDIYYEMHPDLERVDDKTRVYLDPILSYEQRLRRFPTERVPDAWIRGSRTLIANLLEDAVDGPVREEKIEVDPAEISRKIKGFAKYLGAGMVGITKLNPAWVYSHSANLSAGDWGKPIDQLYKYAIVMAFPQDWDLWLTGANPTIPAYVDSGHRYSLMAAVAVRLAAAIRDMGYPARAQMHSNYTCLMPPLAVDAGLGEQCRIGICITKEYGLAFRLCAVTTDLPLIPDPPTNLGIEDFCSKCTKCADACPAGDISKGDKVEVNGLRVWKQDVYKCFHYWNTRGVSCTTCRRVCPWSKPRTIFHRSVANLAINVSLVRRFLIWADDVVYGKNPRYYPPPKWLQSEEQKVSLARRFLYLFDHM